MKSGMLGLVLLCTTPACCMAQSADPATRELIEKLLTRIDSLEKRIVQLEAGNASARVPGAETPVMAAAPTVPTVPSAPGPAQAHAHDQAPVSNLSPEAPFLKIAGFTDFGFAASNLHGANGGFGTQTLLNQHSGFQEGQFALHMSSALSPKVSAFGELSMTARADAGTGTPAVTGFNVELERLIIRYDLNDYFKVSFGRYHTPINYWNTAYHHGEWLQTTASRPEMTQFGGSFIPVHFIGTLVEGSLPAGGLNLNYNFGLGNGRGQILSRGGDFGDINNNRAWLANLFVKPDKAYGLQMGGSIYRDELNPLNPSGVVAREWIESGHIVWQKETPEFIAEFANVRHEFRGGGSANSQAFYAQSAYRLPFANKWKPYYRFEQIHVPRSDAIFRPVVPTFSGSTAGLRFDFASFAAFKLEYRNYWRRDLPNIRGIFTQTSFTF